MGSRYLRDSTFTVPQFFIIGRPCLHYTDHTSRAQEDDNMTLDQLKPGEGGVILTVGGEGALRRHLLDMGLTPKTHVQVRKVAPMGDPIELFLRGYVLTIRKEDAAKLTIQKEAAK